MAAQMRQNAVDLRPQPPSCCLDIYSVSLFILYISVHNTHMHNTLTRIFAHSHTRLTHSQHKHLHNTHIHNTLTRIFAHSHTHITHVVSQHSHAVTRTSVHTIMLEVMIHLKKVKVLK